MLIRKVIFGKTLTSLTGEALIQNRNNGRQRGSPVVLEHLSHKPTTPASTPHTHTHTHTDAPSYPQHPRTGSQTAQPLHANSFISKTADRERSVLIHNEHTHTEAMSQTGLPPLPSATPTHVAYCSAAFLVFCLNRVG